MSANRRRARQTEPPQIHSLRQARRKTENGRQTISVLWRPFSVLRAQRAPGGARRDRTDDLLLAKQALSQLSYGPAGPKGRQTTEYRRRRTEDPPSSVFRPLSSDLVGLDRLERSTSPLSGVRSNHLSYR